MSLAPTWTHIRPGLGQQNDRVFQWIFLVLAIGSSDSDGNVSYCDERVSTTDDADLRLYLLELKKVMSNTTMSTSFSGVDTPATAMAMMSAGIHVELGLDCDAKTLADAVGPNLWAIEKFSKSQFELEKHPFGPKCIFGDINDFWQDSVRLRLDALKQSHLIQTVLKDLVMGGREYMDVSKNRGTPKWMVYNGKPY